MPYVPSHRLGTYGRDFCYCCYVRLEQPPGPCPQPERHWGRFHAFAKNFYVCTALAHWTHYI